MTKYYYANGFVCDSRGIVVSVESIIDEINILTEENEEYKKED